MPEFFIILMVNVFSTQLDQVNSPVLMKAERYQTQKECEEVLIRFLGSDATARRVSGKLYVHFVGDNTSQTFSCLRIPEI